MSVLRLERGALRLSIGPLALLVFLGTFVASDRATFFLPNRSFAGAQDTLLSRPDDRALSIGFYVNDDDNSLPDLKRGAPYLDWLIPSWLSLEGPGPNLRVYVDEKVLQYLGAAKPGMPILPMVQNYSNDRWDSDGLATLMANPTMRRTLVQQLRTFLDDNRFQGITVDFEEVPPSAHPNLKIFLQELSENFAGPGYIIVLAVPMDNDDWPYVVYAKIVDYLLLMGYDEHWPTGEPGSIAGQGWFEKALDKRMQTLNPARTIVSLGGYGYDWVDGSPAEPLSFRQALFSAWKSEADIIFDPETLNPHFSFVEGDGRRHDIWFLDVATAFNEIHAADSYRPAGYALWRLGLLDTSIWSVMARPYGAAAPTGLRGRTIKTNQEGDIVSETYVKVPASQ